MKNKPHRFFRRASPWTGYASDAYAEGRITAVADAFGQGRGYFAAEGSVAVNHFCGAAGEVGLERVGVDDGAAQKIARAAAEGGEAFGQQAAGAGFRYGNGGVAHLQPVADDLLQRFSVARVDGVVEFVFNRACNFVDATLRGVESGGAGFEV